MGGGLTTSKPGKRMPVRLARLDDYREQLNDYNEQLFRIVASQSSDSAHSQRAQNSGRKVSATHHEETEDPWLGFGNEPNK